MSERSIAEAEVGDVLAQPLEVIGLKYSRKAACKQGASGKYTVVIFEDLDEGFLVVTAVKVDKNRAKRYGFTRV
jgi:hypothetical protein